VSLLSENLDFIKNFPFPTLRDRQSDILNEIGTAFVSGYKYIILEAATGFGKSPVTIAVARTLGTSYICTSTKDLQTQYAKDFPFVMVAKGKNNFDCEVKYDFIKNGTYKCGLDSNNAKCRHITADYGPCMTNESFKDGGCKYRTFLKDYKIDNKGTREEKVFIDDDTTNHRQTEYSEWSHLENLKAQVRPWTPCEYYHQLNIALAASHSIFNYSMFLSLLPTKKGFRLSRWSN
jgi:ATP-dependent DNA helicase DinG